MNRKRMILVLVLALITGGLAGLAALQYLQQIPRRLTAAEGESSVQIVVAARDLQVGDALSPEDVRLVSWPSTAVPGGYHTSVDQVLGRGLLVPVQANEPLMDRKMASRESGAGLPILIEPGMRALSVRVNEVIGVAGYVLPGYRVDVLLTMDEGGNPATQIILQNVRTLTAGQSTRIDEDGEPQTVSVVTLLLTPEDAEKLTLASSRGSIQLALRGALDLDEVETPGIRVGSLLELGRDQPTEPRRRIVQPTTNPDQPTVIEVYKGGQRTLVTYND